MLVFHSLNEWNWWQNVGQSGRSIRWYLKESTGNKGGVFNSTYKICSMPLPTQYSNTWKSVRQICSSGGERDSTSSNKNKNRDYENSNPCQACSAADKLQQSIFTESFHAMTFVQSTKAQSETGKHNALQTFHTFTWALPKTTVQNASRQFKEENQDQPSRTW